MKFGVYLENFNLFSAVVYCLFAAVVVSFPVAKNAFVDRNFFVLGVILQIQLIFSEHSMQI